MSQIRPGDLGKVGTYNFFWWRWRSNFPAITIAVMLPITVKTTVSIIPLHEIVNGRPVEMSRRMYMERRSGLRKLKI
jgi:hypothetical protein